MIHIQNTTITHHSCTHKPTTMRIAGDEGRYAVPSVFGHENEIAKHIQAGAEIFCIGGNAAMLDVLRLCLSLVDEQDLSFVVAAPDGSIPEPLVPRHPRRLTKPELSTDHDSAESLLAEIWREIEKARRAGDNMREIRAGFRAHFLATPLTTYLSDPNEARRIPGQLRFWLRGGTRDTILDLQRFVASGLVRIIPAHVAEVTHSETGACVTMLDPSGGPLERETGFVVNCAGAGPNSRYDPLTEQLLEAGDLRICPISKGIVTGPNLHTGVPGLRYLSPSVTVIGDEVMAMPLYDAHMLRSYVRRAGAPAQA